jgi:hypothetical protein
MANQRRKPKKIVEQSIGNDRTTNPFVNGAVASQSGLIESEDLENIAHLKLKKSGSNLFSSNPE